MRSPRPQRTGYRKNAAVLLLTVAFFLAYVCEWRRLPVGARETEAQGIILEGLVSCAEVIDLSSCGIPVYGLGTLYQGLLLEYPELFHVAPRLSYTFEDRGDGVRLVKEIYPTYIQNGEELMAARNIYRQHLSELISEMEAALYGRDCTEAEIVLWLHDTLADRYAYDARPDTVANADAYRLFRDGVGLCQAYALAFLALCREAGVEADLVVSEAMDHAWNHVRVEGVWYHVDVTRDDPIPAAGGIGSVYHTRFLRSDQSMEMLGYYGYTCAAGHTCTDTRFEVGEGGILDGFSTPLVPVSSGWIGVDERKNVRGVVFSGNNVLVGEIGDINVDGDTDPADLLKIYDPSLPEAWREWLRKKLVV